jgi:GTP-binding protein
VRHVPGPKAEARKDEPFQMLSVLIESDPFLGRLLTGRIESGKALPGMAIHALDRNGKEIERGRITKVLAFRGLKRQPIDHSDAGDIVAIAGLSKATVADTLCAVEVLDALPAQPIDPPTISMTVSVNDSPLAGKDGDKGFDPDAAPSIGDDFNPTFNPKNVGTMLKRAWFKEQIDDALGETEAFFEQSNSN